MMSILGFELRLRSRQIATWLYALVFFLLAFLFVSTDVVQVGGGDGPVKATSPSTATMVVVVLAALGSVVSAALVGTAIQRDSDARVADLFATTGISRGAYYWGRFLGAWLVSIAVFCALPLGMVVGSAMPWVDPEVIAPFDPGTWGRIVLFFLVPNLLFTGALFFVFGTATRSLMAVYALGVGLFVLWAVSTGLASQLDNRIVSALSDPFGLGAMGADTRYWTVFEKNSRPIALSGMLLLNRLLWTGVAGALMFAGFAKFSFRADSRLAVGRRLGKKAIAPARDEPADDAPWTPVKSPLSGNRSQALWWSVFRSTVVSTHADMARALAYKVIVFAGLLLLGTNVWMADQVFDNETLLLTPVVLQQGFGSFGLFFIILVTVYSSEAVWRERSVRIDQIADALPVQSSAVALGKYAAVG